MEYTKYAAVGHFKCHRTLDGKKYPVVIVGRKEYMLDVQEMTVWSSLAWRILSRSQIAEAYLKLTRGLSFTSRRTLDDCIDRLVTRGLVAEGRGGSEYEALYDLLSCLYIAPVSANPFLRLGAFLKLWIWNGAPFSKAIRLFSRPKQDAAERQIVRLANQALLSSAELIKCAERGVRTLRSDAQLMDCLYLVATDRLYMDTYGDSPVIRVLDREGIDQIEPLEIQQTAHQQIGTYLDIPSKYYDRMLQRDPALLSYNVNRWFQKEPEQKLLRTMDGKARAFLSNRYRRIDNLDIARVVLPIIGEMEGARFESCEITDDRMYLKVVNPRLQAEVVPGDVVQAGIMISNSETGLGAVNI